MSSKQDDGDAANRKCVLDPEEYLVNVTASASFVMAGVSEDTFGSFKHFAPAKFAHTHPVCINSPLVAKRRLLAVWTNKKCKPQAFFRQGLLEKQHRADRYSACWLAFWLVRPLARVHVLF